MWKNPDGVRLNEYPDGEKAKFVELCGKSLIFCKGKNPEDKTWLKDSYTGAISWIGEEIVSKDDSGRESSLFI